MKKLILLLSLVTCLIAQQNNRAVRAVERGFQNWGIGGGISLAVPDNGKNYYTNYNGYYYDQYGNPIGWNGWDYYWGGCTGVGFGVEVKVPIRFSIGKAGNIHYVPNLSWWGRPETVDYVYNTTYEDIKLYDQKVNINLFDVRYVPPVPKDFVVKPYLGFGLVGFELYTWSEENLTIKRKYKDTEFNIHQDIFVGAEFALQSGIWPYVEFKFTNGAVDDFLMTAGITIQARK